MNKYKYRVYDDMRLLGTYDTLDEVLKSGFIPCKVSCLYKSFAKDGFYAKDNIVVYRTNFARARCLFLAYMIQRRVYLSPDCFVMDPILTKTLKDITKIDNLEV